MNFNKDSYTVIRSAISKELANFVGECLILKKNVAKTFMDSKYISPYALEWGTFKDLQVPETYSCYADISTEVLLKNIKIKMEKETKLKLVETYSYARVYKKGDILAKHIDRNSCEISTTLNLLGDLWPIYLKSKNKKTIKIDLNHGDMLVYKGCELEHWREPFKRECCVQTFLHYNDLNSDLKNINKYDGRIELGLPKINMFLKNN
jgi:hypothetical protein